MMTFTIMLSSQYLRSTRFRKVSGKKGLGAIWQHLLSGQPTLAKLM